MMKSSSDNENRVPTKCGMMIVMIILMVMVVIIKNDNDDDKIMITI